jgi:predicted acylesterase/phospholipase RssA
MRHNHYMPLRRTWKSIALSLIYILVLVAGGGAQAQETSSLLTPELRTRFSDMELMLVFQGKGSCLPYDAGVLHEAYLRFDALKRNRVIVAGNSSGSIPAAFFCCFGFTDDNVKHATETLKLGNRDAVRNMEAVSNKFAKVSRGLPTEISHQEVREYIAFALGVTRWEDAGSIAEIVRRSEAKPRFPCLIVAANKEVLEDKHPEGQLTAARLKELDTSNMDVFWRQEVFDYYRQYPERFEKDHPFLKLGPTRRIGKAVTFFVDASMYALLSQIPDVERTADLRLMTTAEDVATAILASVSEPSYFPTVIEQQPDKILSSAEEPLSATIRQRSYIGGYIISTPAQDVRRMLPGIRVLGTGWRHNPLVARILLKNWLLADCEEVAFLTEYWSDLEVNPDYEFESHIEVRDLTGIQEFEFGRKRARELFEVNRGLPIFVTPPKYQQPAEKAIMPHRSVPDMFIEGSNVNGKPSLKTMRGM